MSQTVQQPDVASKTIGVVGLGYVGLPLAVAFDDAGLGVVGFDVSREKVDALDAGEDPIEEVGDDTVAASDADFTADPSTLVDCDLVVLTVPTPVDDVGTPDFSYIESAGETVGEHMAPGTTVVLESTVYPGATEDVLVPALEAASGLELGDDFGVGYSPERVSPGDSKRGLRDVTKIVSGHSEDAREEIAAVYEAVVDAGIHRVDEIKTAEAAKAIENVQRDINIALVNELAIACDHLDVDAEAVLEAAGTKWNFHDEYRPGLVGGHCIPVDPHLFSYESERQGFEPDLIVQAREINEYMPAHVAEKARKAMNDARTVPAETDLLVMGVAYKPNVGDIRTSKVKPIVEDLAEYGVSMTVHDPYAADDEIRDEFGVDVVSDPDLEAYDGVLFGVGHDEFHSIEAADLVSALNGSGFVVDVPGVVDEDAAHTADLTYRKL
ncbi:nucleotide sugar dehydrogenase [Halorubellus litoreus]|uniref:UDP-N-acetyl-D-mannosamine dehydrogenase n=1 Tax=Halorubellus litoreus TaxID=755308 RepID=A0ABD5VL89_9EURY